jgi:hypothetical protein
MDSLLVYSLRSTSLLHKHEPVPVHRVLGVLFRLGGFRVLGSVLNAGRDASENPSGVRSFRLWFVL